MLCGDDGDPSAAVIAMGGEHDHLLGLTTNGKGYNELSLNIGHSTNRGMGPLRVARMIMWCLKRRRPDMASIGKHDGPQAQMFPTRGAMRAICARRPSCEPTESQQAGCDIPSSPGSPT